MAEIAYLDTLKRKFGWEDFPFSLDLVHEIFAGKEKVLNPIMEQLAFGSIVYIEGNYGSGKSQVLKHVHHKMRTDPAYARWIPILIQEPVTPGVLVHAFTRRFGITTPIVALGDLTDELEARLSGRQSVILLVDEAQELAVQENDPPDIVEQKQRMLQWVRVLSDFRGCRVFLAGLTNFGRRLNEMFRPLEDRVTLKFTLEPMDLETTKDLVVQRVKHFSSDPSRVLHPFTEAALERIYQYSGGYPRAILKACQDAVVSMLAKGRDSIDFDMLPSLPGGPRQVSVSPSISDVKRMEAKDLEREMKSFRDQIAYDSSGLNHTDVQVLKFMATREDVTPQEVADGCSITAGTAANILRKLKEMGYTFRKKQGRTFSYTLYSVFRREYTHA